MGRGRSSSSSSRGRSSSGSRGGSSRSSGSSRSISYIGGHRSHTTVIVGGGGHFSSGSSRFNNIFAAIVLIIIGLFPLSIGISGFIRNGAYAKTTGTCIDNTYSMGWYYTTYVYTVDGIDYINRSNEGWEFEEVIGKSVKIYYLKSDPNEITELLPTDTAQNLIIFFIGVAFITPAIIMIVITLKKKDKDKLEELEPEQKVKICQYCGSKFTDDDISCRNCGAGKQENL